MINISKPFGAAHAEQYFDNHFTVDEYHSEGQKVTGHWIGKGAAELGLAGDVDREKYSQLLQGIDPSSGQVIVAAAHHNKTRRAAWDAVWGTPKSVSVQALVGGDHRLIAAHSRAVDRAMAEVEQYALARKRGGREYVVSANIVGARFDHMAARQAEETRLPDPHLHTHVVMINMTRRPDGAWRSLDPKEIFNAQRLGSAIYRSELAREVQKLGYRIERNAHDGSWELEGYSREQVEAFSQRQQQIGKKMAELGLNGSRNAHEVALSTRQSKQEYDEAELKADWKRRAAEYGIDTAKYLNQAYARGGISIENGIPAQEALQFAKAHLTNREAVVDKRDIEVAALEYGMGNIDLDGLRRATAIQQAVKHLIRVPGIDHRHPQGSFTTPEMLALEANNLRMMRAGQGQAQPIAVQLVIENWGKRKGLSDEQINAAAMMLTSKNWITAIDALAGTGKTTTVGAMRELAEEQGYAVRAFGPTTRSVHELREAGLDNAQTVASLLANQLPSPGGPELWFVDEHSMMDSLTANQLLKAALQLGIDRMILVGDTGQHQAIQAGNPIKQFIDSEMTVARLETIRRQETPKMRAVVKAARYTPAQAFDLLNEQGRINQIADWRQRYTAIAAEYLKARKNGKQALVVSPGNDERREINACIRQQLIEHDLVKDDGRTHEILVDRKFTPAQIRTANSYQQGDVILVRGTRDQQKRGLAKNSRVTVEAVDHRGNALTVRTPEGKCIEVFPARWDKSDAEVFTREHRTLAAGDRVQFRRPDKKHGIANGEFAILTALTNNGANFHFDCKKPRDVTLPSFQMKHLDYGYCSTTYSAQGATVQTCIMNADSSRGERLLNRMGWYVGVSRPKTEFRVFTDDAEALRRAVARDPQKSIALEAIKPPGTGPQQTQNSVEMRI
jgi:conjugative relaxase-like TrwC/TraI family protein